MGKSLAEKLALASNPEPIDFDPENDLDNFSSSSDSESNNETITSHYVDVGRSKLRDDGIALSEGKYKGQPIKRAELENYSESSESESESDASDFSPPKQTKVSQILNNEQKQLLEKLSLNKDSDAQKGKSVNAQMRVYEKLLDLRIQSQKLLINSTKHIEDGSCEKMLPLILKVIKLRQRMQNVNINLNETDLNSLASLNSKLDDDLRTKREQILNKWSRKVELASGRNALNQSKFTNLNQSASLQVNSVLTDTDRLVKRTTVDRSEFNLPESKQQFLFDDTDFYRLLLKDLVDRRMSEQNTQFKLKSAKSKSKKVDTKASKGRKLRYTVVDKIQGFDAPRKVFTWTDRQAEDLYSGLLGVKIDMNENAEVVDEVEVGDFNLFG